MLFLQSLLGHLWPLLLLPGIPFGVLMLWLKRQIKKKNEWRKPFADMPRPAGWLLQEKVEDLQGDLIAALLFMLWGGLIAALTPVSGLSQIIVFVLGGTFCTYWLIRCQKGVRKLQIYRLGLLGEQVVGQMLDRLSSDEFRVFHDFQVQEPGKKPWNIDHIVVLRSGVFAIETKCRRKPNSDSKQDKTHVVTFDGSRLIFPEPLKPDYSSLAQARNNAAWLTKKLSDWNGNPIPVQPVLVLPGWFVEAKSRSDVSVLNHKSLRSYFARRSETLPRDRFNAICAQLDERCRVSC